MSWTKNSMTSI